MSSEVNLVRRRAAIGSSLFFALGPGLVAGVVPWLLTRWQARRPVPGGVPVRAAGVVLIGGGALVLATAFARFVVEGLGPRLQWHHLGTW